MSETALVSAKASGGAKIQVEVTRLDQSILGKSSPGAGRNQEVSIAPTPNLETVWEMISQISNGLGEKLKAAQAKKAIVEFGIDIGLETGQFTALLVKGSAKANVKITLEWS